MLGASSENSRMLRKCEPSADFSTTKCSLGRFGSSAPQHIELIDALRTNPQFESDPCVAPNVRCSLPTCDKYDALLFLSSPPRNNLISSNKRKNCLLEDVHVDMPEPKSFKTTPRNHQVLPTSQPKGHAEQQQQASLRSSQAAGQQCRQIDKNHKLTQNHVQTSMLADPTSSQQCTLGGHSSFKQAMTCAKSSFQQEAEA